MIPFLPKSTETWNTKPNEGNGWDVRHGMWRTSRFNETSQLPVLRCCNLINFKDISCLHPKWDKLKNDPSAF